MRKGASTQQGKDKSGYIQSAYVGSLCTILVLHGILAHSCKHTLYTLLTLYTVYALYTVYTLDKKYKVLQLFVAILFLQSMKLFAYYVKMSFC